MVAQLHALMEANALLIIMGYLVAVAHSDSLVLTVKVAHVEAQQVFKILLNSEKNSGKKINLSKY